MNLNTERQISQTIRRNAASHRRTHRRAPVGFTLVELLIVVVIIGIAAAIAVPMMSSAASFQIRAAANMVAGDLEYAKSMSITTGQHHSVVFDVGNDSYRVVKTVNEIDTDIPHPITKAQSYVVDFRNNSRVDRVGITGADFNGQAKVTFDYLGSPFANGGPLNSGIITLGADGLTKTVTVEPVTGYIFVSD